MSKLQLALGILSGRIESLAGREQYELLGLEYDPDYAHCVHKGENFLRQMREQAERILLEVLHDA